jgi:nicotinate phosphoribosyltransferase
MAHSYVEAHDSEAEAFRAFAALYPETTLLVDTYDSLDGVRKIVALAEELGVDFQVGSIRLDSGDLAALAKESRRILDEGGLDHVRIFASNSLDEHSITALLAKGAPFDGFGVGTRLGTIADQPYLDSVYKLTEYAGQARMKLSSRKSNLPGRKQVYRFYEDGKATHDVIALADEKLAGEPLLQQVMHNGKRTEAGRFRPLSDIREVTAQALTQFPDRMFALDKADPPYRVDLSEGLQTSLDATRRRLERQMAPR